MTRQSRTESPEFSGVFRKIATMDQDIEQLLSGLRGPEYRKTIAAVVTRDFQLEINELQGLTSGAKNSYFQHLG